MTTLRHAKLLAFFATGALVTACSNATSPYHASGTQTNAHTGGYTYHNQASAYYAPQSHAGGQYGHGQNYNTAPPQNGYYGQPQYGYAKQTSYGQQPRGPHSAPSAHKKGSKFSYESLNALEAPVSTEFAGFTFELRGRLDSVGSYSFENNGTPDNRFVGTHRITAEKQLPNRFTVGAQFTGRHEDIGDDNVDYKGRVRGFVGGSWGSIIGGNVQDVVYEDTRRFRGAGRFVGNGTREENLHGDGALGRLADWGGGYQGRYGPTTVSAIVDEDSNYDLGIKFQRPIGNKDYRLTARHNTGSVTAADGMTEFDTKAVTGVAEYVYGSTRYDVSGGYEQLESGAIEADRWFTSAGITTKVGVLSLTGEALYGETDGQPETSAVLAARYDITRGLSATAAVDYQDRQINLGGVNFIDAKDTRILAGLSYGF